MHIDPHTPEDDRRILAVSVPKDLKEKLETWKSTSGKTYTETIEEALERYFREHDADDAAQ